MTRGFAVSAGLDPAVAGPLAQRCAELGYSSLWSGDHGADGLETLAAFAGRASETRLGLVGPERPAAAVAGSVERLGLDPARLTIALAAAGPGALERAAAAWRSELPDARLLALARTSAELRVAAAAFDGAVASWMTPAMIAAARSDLGPAPDLAGIVRAAVGADAETRLAKEEGFARSIPANREHFARLEDPGRTGVACDTAPEVPAALAPYDAVLDELVVRGLAARKLWNLDRIATAAAPAQAAAERPAQSSASRETATPNAK